MTTQRGFTLIEMAIVLVIITILIGGLAMPLSAQIQARRIAETKKTLEEAREAILGYAMTHLATSPATNHYLPCPDVDGDGREDRTSGACTLSYGWMPWVDLGTGPQDAWGNRLRYAVNPQFANANSGFSNTTFLSDPFGICSTHTCPLLTPDIASNVVFVLLSHGSNGWGARNVNGNTLASPSGPDEADNLDSNRTYISRSPSKPGNASGEFDDLTVWFSESLLKIRICPPGSDCNPLLPAI
jgi:prepilin-type N-terminal cleavage/methylation domain-containing protein